VGNQTVSVYLLHRKKIANENRIQSKKFKSDKKQQRRAKIDY